MSEILLYLMRVTQASFHLNGAATDTNAGFGMKRFLANLGSQKEIRLKWRAIFVYKTLSSANHTDIELFFIHK